VQNVCVCVTIDASRVTLLQPRASAPNAIKRITLRAEDWEKERLNVLQPICYI